MIAPAQAEEPESAGIELLTSRQAAEEFVNRNPEALRGMTPEAVLAEYVALTPMGRIEEPEDVADAVLFLASDASRFMTGQGINVTGGVRMD